ncbi:hypothetical protein BUALT_Bualt12G0038700 [Buddleja alternifolia]|uniref:Cysteine proteinase inhibitor n=1 Tax=Buddleja alternifolia TaxID=168488 RepID=A0AAV6WNP6_9LAMI|nr:hypothetical protein BUALT_Bualt12G0038700 [Buddleja alternifolia]
MKMKNKNNNALCFILVLALIALVFQIGFCSESRERLTKMKTTLGGLSNPMQQNSGEIESIGRFAVRQHNKNKNIFLEFGRVVKAKEQVVAGKIYHLTLEAVDGGKKKIYDAKV